MIRKCRPLASVLNPPLACASIFFPTLIELSRPPCCTETCTALHCTALHCTALHCTALHCTALHCTALHCTALPVFEQVQSVLGVTKALPARGGRAPQAAREGLERVTCAALCTAALRHAAAQHRGALEVRSAQAGLQLSLCNKLQSAALHAARLGSLAWVGACVPLLKHGHVGMAVQRHAICQVNQSAPQAILEDVRRTAKAGVVDYSGV